MNDIFQLLDILEKRMYTHFNGYETVTLIEVNPEIEDLIESVKLNLSRETKEVDS